MARYRTASLLLAVALTTIYLACVIAQPHHQFMPDRWVRVTALAMLITWIWAIVLTGVIYLDGRIRAHQQDQVRARADRAMRAVGGD